MRRIVAGAVCAFVLSVSAESRAALSIVSSFNPANTSDLCGLGYDASENAVWVYGCSATDVQKYTPAGVFVSSVPRPGESANDVDVELAPIALTLESTLVPKGSLLFINGETGPADIYAVNKTTGAINETLNTTFGVSHVVGGAYHARRATFFMVQDNVPGAGDENRIAELSAANGSVLNTFQITSTFSVFFGDLEVCSSTGNLLVVSSAESGIAEYTPAGVFVQEHALPVGVSSLAGIGVDDGAGEIWVAGNGGVVWRLAGDACPSAVDIPALPKSGLFGLALLLIGSLHIAMLVRGAAAARE